MLVLIPTLISAEVLSFDLTPMEVRQNLSCFEDQDQILTLKSGDREYLVELPFFVSTPIINTDVVCRKFIEKLPQYLEKNKLSLDLNIEKIPGREEYRITNPPLVNYCVRLEYCWRDLLDYLTASNKLKSCYPQNNLSELLELWRPRFKRLASQPIDRVKVEFFPFVPFVEKVQNRVAAGDLYASTMTLGGDALRNLSKSFSQSRAALFFMLDAGIVFSSGQTTLLNTLAGPKENLFPIPMTSGHSFETIHHWKFITSPTHDESILTSMNLTTSEKTNYIDALYTFPDKDVGLELQGLFLQMAQKQCQARDDFACLSDFSSINNIENRKLQAMLKRTCDELSKKNRPLNQSKYFLEPQTADLEYVYSQMIDQAKEEIIVVTNKFRISKLYQKLLSAAKKKNIKVYLFVKAAPNFETKGDRMTYISESKENFRKIPDPHLKVMLIDRRLLWFGTGNTTTNAFRKASDLYAQTLDPEAIQKILEISAVMLAGFSPETRNYLGIKSPSEHWLYLAEDSTQDYSQFEEPNSRQPWLKRYLKLNQHSEELLKFCDLQHLLIVPETVFLQCLSKTQV